MKPEEQLNLLRQRLAKGEISEELFEELRNELKEKMDESANLKLNRATEEPNTSKSCPKCNERKQKINQLQKALEEKKDELQQERVKGKKLYERLKDVQDETFDQHEEFPEQESKLRGRIEEQRETITKLKN